MTDRIFSGLTDPGLLRTSNQDDYYIDPEGRFFIVADGMGGHAGGQEASRLATAAIKTCLDQHWHTAETATGLLLEQALKQANNAILADQRRHPERADMGTTVVVVTFRDSDPQPWCAHVGDSRLYRLRGHHLEQLTQDHTWIAKAIRAGEVSAAQSRSHPWRHVLSQCLGRDDLSEMGIQPIEVQSGDRLLLCSDGLTEELSDHLIASHLKSIRACEAAATALVNSAKQRGGRDNITVVIVNLSPPSSSDVE
ncbi:PP2C family serine/threonine-protein phosphatase [Nodosilinea sp. E11]|uniref:PP2C family protein-serine/threonine phosphatase n=1 Tax=Nodosilinea sp. E11 TaxID=3037479 RepID=UPI0029342422|nr:PP2C family serine/threonine-protein phosphatase [Nodosilinea sp. E11]WOD40381.1 PP2C family serine/threonine-protein phosphatase [Nodosilinea sp. E11]